MNQETIYCIVCSGNPFYLKIALKQLIRVVGQARILLIGDVTSLEDCIELGISHLDIVDLERNNERLKKLGSVFINDGPNPDAFEMFCFKRFIYLEELLKQVNVKKVVHVDADIIFMEEPRVALAETSCNVPNEFGTFLSSWDLNGIRKFNDYILNGYFQGNPIYRYCDMDALARFIRTRGTNFSIVKERGYDSNIRLDLGFRYFLIKHFFNKNSEGKIGFNSMEAEEIPRISDVSLSKMVDITRSEIKIAGDSLPFVHLQGNTKQYFDLFREKLELD